MIELSHTTVKVTLETKSLLDELKSHYRETYDDIIKRLAEEKLGDLETTNTTDI